MKKRRFPLNLALVGLLILLPIGLIVGAIFLVRSRPNLLDLRGGYRLVFEVPVDANTPDDLAERIIKVLRHRIDPDGHYGLEWRALDKGRFEVLVPLAREESRKARNAYTDALERLETGNIHRSEIWKVLEADEAGRPAAIAALAGQDKQRLKMLEELAEAYDAAMAAKKKIAQARSDADRAKAQQAYQAALNVYEGKEEKLLESNISLRRLQVVLDRYVSPAEAEAIPEKEAARRRLRFTTGLKALKKKHAARAGEIDNVVKLYKKWAEVREYLDDPSDLKRLIAKGGVLEFRIAPYSPEVGGDFSLSAADRDRYVEQLQAEGPEAGRERSDPYQWFKIREDPKSYGRLIIAADEAGEYYMLLSNQADATLLRDGWELEDAYPVTDGKGQPAVGFELDVRGATLFATLTSKHKGHAVAILLDDEVYSAPIIKAAISDRGIITGRFSPEDVANIVRILDAGTLPVRAKPRLVSGSRFGPRAGPANR